MRNAASVFARTFCGGGGGATLLAGAVVLILVVAWAMTSASAQESCPVRPIGLPHDGGGSLASSDCRDPHDSDDYADIYSFQLDARADVTIELDSGAFNAFARLLNNRGTELIHDNDDGSGQNARIDGRLSAGTYQIVVTDYNRDRGTGAYELRVSAGRYDCTTGEITIPYDNRRHLSSDDCRDPYDRDDYADIYSFQLDAEADVTIELDSDAFNAFVRLLDDRGTSLAYDNDDGSGQNARIGTRLPAGEYQIVVTDANNGRGRGAYELNVSSAGRYDCTTGEIVIPHYDDQGSLSSDDCRDPYDRDDYADIYSFRLDAQADVTVELNSDAFDAFVSLLDDRGTELTRDNDGGIGQNARIDTALPAGEYQIVATENNLSSGVKTGSYELRIVAENAYSGEVHEPCPNPDPDPPNSWSGGQAPGGYRAQDTEKVHDAKKLITRVLFQIPGNQDVVQCTSADYNDFGEPGPEYHKGHAGWDVQTTSVAFGATANVPFYSLTDGEVVYVNSRSYGVIGVYDDTDDFTVYYLHARHVYVREGQRVSVDQRLGIQGDTGSPGKEHVHIEVHRGRDHNGKKHPFTGAVNAPNRGGSDTLLLWHDQLNYLCAASADSPLRRDDGQCPPLDEIDAPSPDPDLFR